MSRARRHAPCYRGLVASAAVVGALLTAGCRERAEKAPAPRASESAVPLPPVAPAPESVKPVVLLAGGDLDFSRTTGQRILRDDSMDPFTQIRPWLEAADVRFANLESPLCELGGKTVSSDNKLIFAGPPAAAKVLARGGFEVVSTANNHAWDFGLRCLSETVDNVRAVGIEPIGTDPQGLQPQRALTLQRHGQRFGFVAVTGIFNHGPLEAHRARAHIHGLNPAALAAQVQQLREQVDWVIVSLHAGEEYAHEPIEATQAAFRAAALAGAHVVLGHHPHTPQRVDFMARTPLVMSMGNLVFREHSEHPWTGWGYLTRLTFVRGEAPQIELCPYHLFDAAPQRLSKREEQVFWQHYDRYARSPFAAKRAARSEDGCFELVPPQEQTRAASR